MKIMKLNFSFVPQLIEIDNHTFITNFIDTNSIVVDLGANDGRTSEKIYSTFGCFIYAVEPVPQLFSKIKAHDRLKKYNYCIAAKTEPILLNIPLDNCASIYQHDTEKKIESIVVDGITFDHFLKIQNIKIIDLLKVDIEGAELDLFASLKKENLQLIRQMTVEFHDFLWEDMHDQVELIKNKMVSSGFYCIPFSLNNGNVLFVKKELISYLAYTYLKFIKYVLGIRRILKRKTIFKNINLYA